MYVRSKANTHIYSVNHFKNKSYITVNAVSRNVDLTSLTELRVEEIVLSIHVGIFKLRVLVKSSIK